MANTLQATSVGDDMGLTQTDRIKDLLVQPGDGDRLIDLSQYFAGSDLRYTVTSSDGEIIEAHVTDDNFLVLDAKNYGFSDIRIIAENTKTGETLHDDFRIRSVGENAYTIAVLPDTQDYTSNNGKRIEIFEGMTEWLADHADSLNIIFATHVGDVTYADTSPKEWPYAQQALDKLAGIIPFGLAMGNHDGSHNNFGQSYVENVYPVERLKEMSPENFGGTYDREPDSTENTYWTFTAPDGTKWLSLNLEFGARVDVIRWAGDVIEAHMDHRVMVTSHAYMTWAGRGDATARPLYAEGDGVDYGTHNSPEQATDGEYLYRELIQKYPNVAFVFGGHVFGDGAETTVSYDQFGNPIHQIIANYQNGVANTITSGKGLGSSENGGNGAIRLLTIDPDNDKVYTSTYFAEFDSYLTGSIRSDELDRDVLGGPLRGHEEVLDIDLSGPPELAAVAQAGNDQFIHLSDEQQSIAVTLNGDKTINPANGQLTYSWIDTNGVVVSTDANPVLELSSGRHAFTLTVKDEAGNVSTDDVLVQIGDENTLLMQNFNDGSLAGWRAATKNLELSVATTTEHGIAALNGTDANVTYIPALNPSQGIAVTLPSSEGVTNTVKEYSLVFDILIKPGVKNYFSFLQTDPTNRSDLDLALRNKDGNSGGIGIAGDYEGTVKYGEWNRIAFTVTDRGDSVLISKYINGEKVGETVQGGGNYGRYSIDLSKGFLLFADENNETSGGYLNSVLFTDKVLNSEEIALLGNAKPGDIMEAAPTENSVQINFSQAKPIDSFGNATISTEEVGGGTSSFSTKGTYASYSEEETGGDYPALEGRLFEDSLTADKMLVWTDPAAQEWRDYSFEATLQNTGQNEIGLIFYYQDKDNHYRVEFDVDTNSRNLIKVVDGVETTLASDNAGTPWTQDFQVKVVVNGDEIRAFLDGTDIFGAVTDASPLKGGSVGFYSDLQYRSQFDNAVVTQNTLTAHAGSDAKLADLTGSGQVELQLSAAGSYGPDDISSYEWRDTDGNLIATGAAPTVTLTPGAHRLTLNVTDDQGNAATDIVNINVLAHDKVLANDDFSDDLSSWTIIDEGEFGGVGADQTSSQWELRDGELVQLSDLASRQLIYAGTDNSDPWQTGWSPLGDGTNILRRGTYALYNDESALEWSDYAVETTISTRDNGALGLMFYYQDPDNYYKLELDASGVNDRSAGNNISSLFQLTQVKDGVEVPLNQFFARYTPNENFKLRVEIQDNKIQAYVDDMALFAYPIETHAHEKGSFALYSWGSAGLSFDNVIVTSLKENASPEVPGNGVLQGTEGADVLLAGENDDLLFGFDGDDHLLGGKGDDLLEGGKGADTVEGGTGADIYLYNVGDSLDLIIEEPDTVQDVLTLQDLSRDDLIFYKHGADIQIKAPGDDDMITLSNQRISGGIELLTLADGSLMTSADILNAVQNRKHVANRDRLDNVDEDSPTFEIMAAQLLANDIDPDLDELKVVKIYNAKGGTAELTEDGNVRFTLDQNHSGKVSFSYTVTDGKFKKGAMVTFMVNEVNDAPILTQMATQMDERDMRDIDLLVDAFDVEGDELTLTGFEVTDVTGIDLQPEQAALAFSIKDNQLRVDPGAAFEALDKGQTAQVTLRYAVSDDQGGTSQSTLTLDIAGYTPPNIIDGSSANDFLIGSEKDDLITAASGNDRLLAGEGDDMLEGGSGHDLLSGGEGDDSLLGGSSNDVLTAGEGNDLLDGGTGNDVLTGGEGSDTFRFAPAAGFDNITDFRITEDIVEIDQEIFVNYTDMISSGALTDSEQGAVLKLEQGTQMTFAGLSEELLTSDLFTFV